MKIYVSNLNESWIVDRLRNEWIDENDKFSTDDIKEAGIIWIISPWTWNKIPKRHLKNKYVFCTIKAKPRSNLKTNPSSRKGKWTLRKKIESR